MLSLSVALVYLALLFPSHPGKFGWSNWAQFPLELPVLILLLLAANQKIGRWLSLLLTLAIGLLLLLRLADLGSYLAFNRRFSPLLEIHLVADGWNLASTAVGRFEAGIIVAVVFILLLALGFLLYRCLCTISQVKGKTRTVSLGFVGVALLIGGTALAYEHRTHRDGPVEANVIPEIALRITSLQRSIADQRTFTGELGLDNVMNVATPTFGALAGRDVILVFVESYGRGYLDAERFSATAHSRLAKSESTLSESGLSVKSSWLTSPVRGGRSWLAQATLQSGLEIDNQARFDRLVTSDRLSLSGLFAQAGWYTTGIMPAIQLAWPEGVWYGYEGLYTNSELGFSGERFGYVTMPDQYTLSHFENHIRQPSAKPMMATLALLSTHAPWTPLPQKIDWELVGDGSIYDGSHRFGDPISWEYREQVQDMYEKSFDYTLDILAEYAARYADDALMIVVGDHQPPPIINGWGNSADVPIHIISKDKFLLERLPANEWVNGMLPDADSPSQRMSSLRQTLSTLFEH
ncbi:sulfatase [Granulosicoccus antarcticus]|uniref:sulfatase n=1 Tax=Granulosicoccus antarcticus TaxID=437505 RepID=UPI000B5AACD1|nr:sulfatase [Granulosicoccus antarcticus]